MQLARFLNNIFKNDGFILIDADSKKYIIGTPKKKTPITLKILKKRLHYKLLCSALTYILVKLILMEISSLKTER